MFKEASERGHSEATKELAEYYFYGRGCEIDFVKAAKLGSSKAALELGIQMEMEGKEYEYMRYL